MVRKMLGDWRSPQIQSLMRLIETQSKATIAAWCVAYSELHILPLYEKSFPSDARPRAALQSAKDWLDGKIKLPEVKKIILNAHAAAREAAAYPAAQAAARAVGQAAAVIHAPTHALGIAFYGAAAIAYNQIGVKAKEEEYNQLVTEVFVRMEAALRSMAVESEPNPAKINWRC
jgi:hypothetical protein